MNKRQASILVMLCSSETFVTARSLSNKYQVSTKTIYKDLDEVSNFLKNTNLHINRKRHVGIKIEGCGIDKEKVIGCIQGNQIRKKDLIPYCPDKRRASLVKKIILDGLPVALKDSSEKWLVSKTSILNDIDLINKIIAGSSGSIVSSNNQLIYEGSEEQRQIAVTTYLVSIKDKNDFSRIDQVSFLCTQEIVMSIDEIFMILERQWFSKMPRYYMFALRVITMIQVYRIKNGVHFHYQNKATDEWKQTDAYQMASNILTMASHRLDINYQNDDVIRLSRNLSAYRIGTGLRDNVETWEKTIDTLITRMEAIQKINFLSKERLRNQLLYHIPAMILRLKQGMVVKNPLLNDIKSQYSALFGMTWYALSFLEEEYGVSLNDDEVSFITIYFHMALNKNIPQNGVLIVYGEHSQLKGYVESQIEQLLPANTKFSTISVSNLKNTDTSSIGLIIAVDVTGIITKIPVVMVSPLMDDCDQANILISFAKNVILSNQNLDRQRFSVLNEFINTDLIFWKDGFSDKNSALNFLITKLERKGIVRDSFRESIYRREKLGSTEVEGGSALPHAAPETVKKMAVAMLILKKPVWWNSENVNVIVLVCVPNEQVKVYRDLILDIYRLLKDKAQVQMITHLGDTKKLLNIIRN